MKWVKAPGWDDYEVSDTGEMRRNGKVLASREDKKGYLTVRVCSGGEYHVVKIHRMVALAFVDGDKTLTVDHVDGDKRNNLAQNLQWVTSKENTIRGYARQDLVRKRCGSLNGNASLTREQVDTGRSLYLGGAGVAAIARSLGVPYMAMSHALSTRTWPTDGIARLVKEESWIG